MGFFDMEITMEFFDMEISMGFFDLGRDFIPWKLPWNFLTGNGMVFHGNYHGNIFPWKLNFLNWKIELLNWKIELEIELLKSAFFIYNSIYYLYAFNGIESYNYRVITVITLKQWIFCFSIKNYCLSIY